MKQQLALIEQPRIARKLDRKTIETGRKGVAAAREALREAAERSREQQAA
ncbi:MAG: hypothetical protein QOI47_854 [Actinomycetota bacterium]|jgi:hypothetical protein|nr:hypothetical protein [Actinomycetota bacterium]